MADYSTLTDQQLLDLLREGDDQAFGALYAKYWDSVFGQAFTRTRQADIAENITQDIFLHLWNHRFGNHIERLEPYLYTAVKNRVFKWFRQQAHYTPISDLLAELRASSEQSDAPLIEKEFVRAYEALINRLPASQQAIYRMRFQQDLSTVQIAQELGISRKTVQNRLSLAIAALRESLFILLIISMLS